MPLKCVRTICSILIKDKMDITRLGLIFGSLLWAVLLLLPVELFPTAAQIAAGKGRTTYALMATVATERFWGMAFLTNAIFSSLSLFCGIRSRITLLLDGVLGCLLWTGSTLLCFAAYWPHNVGLWEAIISYPPPAAMSGEIVMAFYSWWHMVRHWAEEPTNRCLNPENKDG